MRMGSVDDDSDLQPRFKSIAGAYKKHKSGLLSSKDDERDLFRSRLGSTAELAKYYGFNNKTDLKQYTVRNTMTKIYRKYYALWVEFDILLSIFALAGLGFAIQNYHMTFNDLHIPGNEPDSKSIYAFEIFSLGMLIITMGMGLMRQRMRSYWNHYRKPFTLLKVLTLNAKRGNGETQDAE
jgi:hypothetical protein